MEKQKKRERKIKTEGIHHHEHEKRVSTKAIYSKYLISQARIKISLALEQCGSPINHVHYGMP